MLHGHDRVRRRDPWFWALARAETPRSATPDVQDM
jgi:hypothetical protein